MGTLTEAQVDKAYRLFYGEGKNLGEVGVELGCGVYDLSPWLVAPAMRIADDSVREERATVASRGTDNAVAVDGGR